MAEKHTYNSFSLIFTVWHYRNINNDYVGVSKLRIVAHTHAFGQKIWIN